MCFDKNAMFLKVFFKTNVSQLGSRLDTREFTTVFTDELIKRESDMKTD